VVSEPLKEGKEMPYAHAYHVTVAQQGEYPVQNQTATQTATFKPSSCQTSPMTDSGVHFHHER
jgi:hypothetical protein